MKITWLLASSILPLLAMAHPGHGDTDGYTIIHYFTEPMHAIVTLGSIIVLYAGYRFFRRKNERS